MIELAVCLAFVATSITFKEGKSLGQTQKCVLEGCTRTEKHLYPTERIFLDQEGEAARSGNNTEFDPDPNLHFKEI